MARPGRILIIDDDRVTLGACRRALERDAHQVETAQRGKQGLDRIDQYAYDVVLLDLRMPDLDGLNVLSQIKKRDPVAVVIIISAQASVRSAVDAMKMGATDFLPKPFTPEALRAMVNAGMKKRRLAMDNLLFKEQLGRLSPKMIGDSEAMAEVSDLIERVAPTDATVLITGESGTGKGLVARQIHKLSTRAARPLVTVNCSTLVPTLFESELFGHVRGAFTGAEADKIGTFELADGGTLFLDEITNINLEIQAKLLTAVEEKTVTRVGSNRVFHVDARVLAATNRDLQQAVAEGTFREDLFYRLDVVSIHMPPLRERKEDIPFLARHFLEMYNRLRLKKVKHITSRAMDALTVYSWPGNVRELENTIERMVVLSRGETIDHHDVRLQEQTAPVYDSGTSWRLTDVERTHIARALDRFGGHITNTAQALGIDRKTLRMKIRRYGIDTG